MNTERAFYAITPRLLIPNTQPEDLFSHTTSLAMLLLLLIYIYTVLSAVLFFPLEKKQAISQQTSFLG